MCSDKCNGSLGLTCSSIDSCKCNPRVTCSSILSYKCSGSIALTCTGIVSYKCNGSLALTCSGIVSCKCNGSLALTCSGIAWRGRVSPRRANVSVFYVIARQPPGGGVHIVRHVDVGVSRVVVQHNRHTAAFRCLADLQPQQHHCQSGRGAGIAQWLEHRTRD